MGALWMRLVYMWTQSMLRAIKCRMTSAEWMKGTEVPNPQRSSAVIVHVCWLENRSLSRDSPCLPCALFCSSRVSDALSQALCNLSWAFLADFLYSIWFYCSHTFHSFTVFSRKLAFRLDRKTRSQCSHVFCLTGAATLHCRHTFVGGILTPNGQ